jgi:histidinol phosphatase-like enzyme (inositol monophosphatase family)
MRVDPALLSFANRLGDIAGEILRGRAALPPVVEIKPDGSLVTDADKAVEQAVRAEIMRAWPGHGIRGEEFPAHQPDAEYLWIIDPLDGTREYTQGLPLWGFLLALAQGDRFVLGLAEQPQLRHRWVGAEGHGTLRDGRAVRVGTCARLAEAVVSTMGYDTFGARRHAVLSRLRARVPGRALVTADSFYVFGLLAEGRVDLIAADNFALHDHAALDAIVRCAGGVVTDWDGRALTRGHAGSILAAATAGLHAEALEALRQ